MKDGKRLNSAPAPGISPLASKTRASRMSSINRLLPLIAVVVTRSSRCTARGCCDGSSPEACDVYSNSLTMLAPLQPSRLATIIRSHIARQSRWYYTPSHCALLARGAVYHPIFVPQFTPSLLALYRFRTNFVPGQSCPGTKCNIPRTNFVTPTPNGAGKPPPGITCRAGRLVGSCGCTPARSQTAH